ncbi:MAG TPA: 1-phosphofructokinase family hexose kinase [Thermoleophilia bacterium]|nr:1-phosphofructokinase family hexose kinase [Thermoleophilia bacterium]
MILTVTLNAAVDRTLTVPNFEVGFRHRASETITLPGGKGINVARVVKTLGQPVIATGFAGGRTGDRIISDLNREGILSDFVRIEGVSRTSTAVLDPTTNRTTEINEYGPDISPRELELMLEKIDYLMKAADLVIVAGSLPSGLPTSFYGELIPRVRAAGVPVLFDTWGEALRLGIKASPDVVFPNQVEAEMVVGYEFSSNEDFIRAAENLRDLGARSAVIKSKMGCVAKIKYNGDVHTLMGKAPKVEAVSTVGSGDSIVGGYAAKLLEGAPPEDCLRFGLACAAANALRPGAGVFDPNDAARLAPGVEMEEV